MNFRVAGLILLLALEAAGAAAAAPGGDPRICVIPAGEKSVFHGWSSDTEVFDLALFRGVLRGDNTKLVGRQVTEGPPGSGKDAEDSCFFSGSIIERFSDSYIVGNCWTIQLYGNEASYAYDPIGGFGTDLAGYYYGRYKRTCQMGVTQGMKIFCPLDGRLIHYHDNRITIAVGKSGTVITRDGTRSTVAPPTPAFPASTARSTVSSLIDWCARKGWTHDASPSPPETPAPLVIRHEPRPLAAALDELERRHGMAVSYEDPPYPDQPGTVETVAMEAEPDAGSGADRPAALHKIPQRRSLTFVYAAEDLADATGLAGALLQQAAAGDPAGLRPGMSILDVDGSLVMVPDLVPSGTQASHAGMVRPVQAVLDAAVDLPEQPRNGLALLTALVRELRRVTGVEVLMGMIPASLLASRTSTLGARNEPAREVLIRGLAALGFGTGKRDCSAGGPHLVWRLLYDPEIKAYALNLHLVEAVDASCL